MKKETRKILELKQYRKTRKVSDNDFMLGTTMNLLSNLAVRSNIIHGELRRYREIEKQADENLKVLIGYYISSLITCWETFFRDLFIFICNEDADIKSRLNIDVSDALALDLTIGEYTARKYNFQNLTNTREAFDYIFAKNTTELSDYFTNNVINGLIVSGYAKMFEWIAKGIFKKKVDELLALGFSLRHKITHDANYRIDISGILLSEIEHVFQVIPQFFVSHIAERYGQKRIVFNIEHKFVHVTDSPSEKELHYAFTIDDFISTNWKVED